MGQRRHVGSVGIAGFLLLVLASATPPVAARQRARIEGRVKTTTGVPVVNVRVTLKNDGYSPLRTVYTDSAGRFQFAVSEGAFYVEVDPLDRPFERHQERIDLNPTPYSKLGELFLVDIVLTPRKNPNAKPESSGVVFYQQVPDAAKVEYERGLKLIPNKRDEGCAALRRALQIFPDYYAAMEALGGEYARAGHYDHALPILIRAVEVNPAGAKSYYALGVVFFQMKHFPNAVKAFARVAGLEAENVNATVYLGLALLRSGRLDEAEAALKRTYELGAKGISEVQLALSEIYIEQRRYDRAVAELERLLDENPSRNDRKKIERLIESLRAKASQASARATQ